jgi:phage repressor protein C with HTH and peptisase S24 domain
LGLLGDEWRMENRIRYWRDLRGYSRKKLAEMVRTGETQIVKLERGERRLTQHWMERIAKALEVEPADLMPKKPSLKADSFDPDAPPEPDLPLGEDSDPLHIPGPMPGGIREVDVRASAGTGAVVDYEGENHIWGLPEYWVRTMLNAPPADLRIITIEGDSMISDPPKRRDLEPGDKVVVNIADRVPSPPGIFVLHDGLGLIAKRLYHDEGKVVVASNNNAYPTKTYDLADVNILGRVVGRWERL